VPNQSSSHIYMNVMHKSFYRDVCPMCQNVRTTMEKDYLIHSQYQMLHGEHRNRLIERVDR